MTYLNEGKTSMETNIVFFIFVCLLLGGLFRTLKQKFHYSYTPLLLLSGILLNYALYDRPLIGPGIQHFLDIDPYGMLSLFVPIIIFEPAFEANYHNFIHILPQIAILALPVFLISAFISAVAFQCLVGFQNGITWAGALTLGVLVSITDPNECVDRLNYKKASHKFTTLIELESLANDGTGIILFNIFQGLAVIKHTPAPEIGYLINKLIYQGFGGIGLGLVFSIVSRFWLQYIYNDTVNIINVMIVASYIMFYIAEYTVFQVSGFLSLLVLGLSLSKNNETMIERKTQKGLHGFMKYALYMCETLIFVGSGIFIGDEL